MRKIVLFLALASCCFAFGSKAEAPTLSAKPLADQFTLTSPVFNNGGPIPELYTCKAADINPPLQVNNPPQGTRSFVLVLKEPDNPIGSWSHWLVYNISPATREIKQNSVPGAQALNDFGNFYYGGPCVFDAKAHHFVFTIYALNTFLDDVNEGATLDTMEKVLKGKVIDKAQLVGVYQNPLWGQDGEKPL